MFPHFAEKIMFGSVYPGGKIAAFYTPFIYSYPLSMSNSRKALLRLVGLSTSTDIQRPEWPHSSNSLRVLLLLVGLVASIDKAAYRRYYPAKVAGVNYSPKGKVDYLALIIIYTPLDRLRYSSEPIGALLVPAVL